MSQRKIFVMINGLPGKMASLVEAAVSKRTDFQVVKDSLTGPDTEEKYCKGTIRLHKPFFHHDVLNRLSSLIKDDLIAIDFTQPSGIMDNARLYCDYKIPFVMGTTGGDRQALAKMVADSEIPAVIAPNMSAPIVMLMDMFEYAANHYPGAISGWEIRIIESHQAEKKDTSGTAIAIGKILESIGVNYAPEHIRSVRDKIEQLLMGIPASAIDGHGWHKYSLISPDGNVQLGFEHNINGRNTYVDGTLMALDFLSAKVEQGFKGKCFSMRDAIRE
ncbi:MAG: dihydrodipicolinate reductase C-terminal domain-containing protein [Parcubacteria group bacterium]|jgi:4-hydroxy-tetrahydrodipicolinate reductase